MSILNYFGYIGNFAFVIVGIIIAKRIGLRSSMQLLSGVSTAFFGGVFARDLLLLRTVPAILSKPAEMAVTLIVGIVTIAVLNRCKNIGRTFYVLLCAADSIGIVGFCSYGIIRGTEAGANWQTALACAFVTACGGGVIAAGIRAFGTKDWRHFAKTIAEKRPYYTLCAFVSVVCGACFTHYGYPINATIVLTTAVIIGGFIVEWMKAVQTRRRDDEK